MDAKYDAYLHSDHYRYLCHEEDEACDLDHDCDNYPDEANFFTCLNWGEEEWAAKRKMDRLEAMPLKSTAEEQP